MQRIRNAERALRCMNSAAEAILQLEELQDEEIDGFNIAYNAVVTALQDRLDESSSEREGP